MVALESVSFVTRRLFVARAASPEFGAHPSAKPETHHDAIGPVAASRTTRGHRRPGAAGAFAVSTWGGACGSSEATEFISSGLFAATLRAPLGESATEASVLGEKPSGRRARSPPCASTRWRRRSTSLCRRSCAWCRQRAMSAPVPRVLRELRGRDCAGVGRLRGPTSALHGVVGSRTIVFQTDKLPSVVERLLVRLDATGNKKQKRFVAFAAHAFEPAARGKKPSRWTPSPGTWRQARRRSTARGSGPNAPTGYARRSRSRRVDTHGRARRVYVRSVT